MTIHQGYRQQVRLNINGIVQGVGFRPFVYRLATELNLVGSVLNNQQGVCIHLQGLNTDINRVVHQLKVNPPPLARIDKLMIKEEAIDRDLTQFEIKTSHSEDVAVVSISADKSTCGDCLLEMRDPNNRHYLYPFTNCTNCGPRYSIVKQLPYDRVNTSMATFEMCDDCAHAYHDPLNRRYHAQPVSCPNCGPQIRYSQINSDKTITSNANDKSHNSQHVLQAVVNDLNQGKIIAIKGLGGFHLICDATNAKAVNTLRLRKQRKTKPFAVMAVDINQAKQIVSGSLKEWQILNSAEKPITLLKKRDDIASTICDDIAPGIDTLGVFLPYTPLHYLLLDLFKKPIVATSANKSSMPIITDSQNIMSQLGDVIDGILDHNRDIVNACDDSVVQVINDELQVIRLARGCAPLSIPLPHSLKHALLGVGAQQKNTQCYAFNENAFVSPYIGDLFNLETDQHFIKTLSTFNRLYQFNPEQIITDKHPTYSSSLWAAKQADLHQLPLAKVQHHYAHVLSVLAANNYQHNVIAFSFDGTGLGDDEQLWGSECMVADADGFELKAHLNSFKLIGGEQAIKQPVRILLALLFESMTIEQVMSLPINAIQQMDKSTITNLHTMWRNDTACIHSRSMGRLFDAVAVALDLIVQNDFEAQSGMLIETYANEAIKSLQYPQNQVNALDLLTLQRLDQTLPDACPVPHLSMEANTSKDQVLNKSPAVFNTALLIQQLVKALPETSSDNKQAHLCLAFINSIADMVYDIANQSSHLKVVLCGGVFQNKLLNELVRIKLTTHDTHLVSNLKTYANRSEINAMKNTRILPSHKVPINDSGISVGQVWYAYQQLNRSQTQH
ncbi:carbamoyltransferase HypF [Shewanella japonica]|uniref:Carbamoyltransferase HypF n=1 Tax=Shewanella japonica TaxID=93973 RepID=A0ABN4YGP3_9GAMM|nr:carbamoyltransferase HypF [Shewanella japonica]ARD22297.1 (NiFe) hydrogenase maturation protein HypF [Shewanella japonica]